MDADAVSAALTPRALAPAIAKSLGLQTAAVETALTLLAFGAQPAFLARSRRERIGDLTISDLERIQARAAAAVAFEFRRAEILGELDKKKIEREDLRAHVRRAQYEIELEDIKALWRKRKRGPAAKARAAGLTAAAIALWKHGSDGSFSDPATHPDRNVAHARPGKKARAGEPASEGVDDEAELEGASAEAPPESESE